MSGSTVLRDDSESVRLVIVLLAPAHFNAEVEEQELSYNIRSQSLH